MAPNRVPSPSRYTTFSVFRTWQKTDTKSTRRKHAVCSMRTRSCSRRRRSRSRRWSGRQSLQSQGTCKCVWRILLGLLQALIEELAVHPRWSTKRPPDQAAPHGGTHGPDSKSRARASQPRRPTLGACEAERHAPCAARIWAGERGRGGAKRPDLQELYVRTTGVRGQAVELSASPDMTGSSREPRWYVRTRSNA